MVNLNSCTNLETKRLCQKQKEIINWPNCHYKKFTRDHEIASSRHRVLHCVIKFFNLTKSCIRCSYCSGFQFTRQKQACVPTL